MAEKTELLNSPDVGKDEDAAIKLLTKHKVKFVIKIFFTDFVMDSMNSTGSGTGSGYVQRSNYRNG